MWIPFMCVPEFQFDSLREESRAQLVLFKLTSVWSLNTHILFCMTSTVQSLILLNIIELYGPHWCTLVLWASFCNEKAVECEIFVFFRLNIGLFIIMSIFINTLLYSYVLIYTYIYSMKPFWHRGTIYCVHVNTLTIKHIQNFEFVLVFMKYYIR